MHTPSRTAAVALVLAATTLAACKSSSAPEPTPSPSVSETLDLEPVVGEWDLVTTPTASGPILGLGDPAEADQAQIEAAAQAIADWLDAHLDSLQHGDGGLLDEVADPRLAGPVTAATTDLTDPQAPVASARYALSAQQDGAADVIAVAVEVTRTDGSVALASLVFVVDDDGAPRLILLGPDAAPSDEPSDATSPGASTPTAEES